MVEGCALHEVVLLRWWRGSCGYWGGGSWCLMRVSPYRTQAVLAASSVPHRTCSRVVSAAPSAPVATRSSVVSVAPSFRATDVFHRRLCRTKLSSHGLVPSLSLLHQVLQSRQGPLSSLLEPRACSSVVPAAPSALAVKYSCVCLVSRSVVYCVLPTLSYFPAAAIEGWEYCTIFSGHSRKSTLLFVSSDENGFGRLPVLPT